MRTIVFLIIYFVSVGIILRYRERYVDEPYDLLDHAMVFCPPLNSLVFIMIVFASTYYVLTNTVEGIE